MVTKNLNSYSPFPLSLFVHLYQQTPHLQPLKPPRSCRQSSTPAVPTYHRGSPLNLILLSFSSPVSEPVNPETQTHAPLVPAKLLLYHWKPHIPTRNLSIHTRNPGDSTPSHSSPNSPATTSQQPNKNRVYRSIHRQNQNQNQFHRSTRPWYLLHKPHSRNH